MLPWIYLLDLEIVCDEINKYIYICQATDCPQDKVPLQKPNLGHPVRPHKSGTLLEKSFLNSPHRRMPYRTINQVDRISCQHLGVLALVLRCVWVLCGTYSAHVILWKESIPRLHWWLHWDEMRRATTILLGKQRSAGGSHAWIPLSKADLTDLLYESLRL